MRFLDVRWAAGPLRDLSTKIKDRGKIKLIRWLSVFRAYFRAAFRCFRFPRLDDVCRKGDVRLRIAIRLSADERSIDPKAIDTAKTRNARRS